MFASLKSEVRATARRAGLLSGGLFAVAIGTGFLTVAAWIYLVAVADPLTAALTIGAAYFGFGLIVMGLASRPSAKYDAQNHEPAPHKPASVDQPPLMQAFMYGMTAGTNASQVRNS